MIIDASVGLKWILQENLSATALTLLVRDDLRAPDIIDAEVMAALTRKVRQRIVPRPDVHDCLRDFLETPVMRVAWQAHAMRAFDLSLALNGTHADCLYLALALDSGDILVTSDEKFLRAIKANPTVRSAARSLSEF